MRGRPESQGGHLKAPSGGRQRVQSGQSPHAAAGRAKPGRRPPAPPRGTQGASLRPEWSGAQPGKEALEAGSGGRQPLLAINLSNPTRASFQANSA